MTKLPFCAAYLLLLPLVLQEALANKPESSAAPKTIREWNSLRRKIQSPSIWGEGKLCNADADLSHAYFLLVDLIQFHPNEIIKWAWPRYDFYFDVVKNLTTAYKSNTTFCSYRDYFRSRLVCDENKCAKCDGLREEANAMLKKACGYNGTGGAEEQVTGEDGSIPEPKVWTPSDEACTPGWLTKDVAQQLYRSAAEGRGTEFQPCDYAPAVAVAFKYASLLVQPNVTEKEIEEKREFWEDKLRILKDGKAKGLTLCYPKWGVCGKDSVCISCDDVKEEMAEIYEACKAKDSTPNHEVMEECVASRQKMTTTTSTEAPKMTTLNSTSGALTHRQLALALFVHAATIFATFPR